MKRLFFALWPDDATREAIQRVADRLPATHGSGIPEENLHLTLSFIGVADADYESRLVQQATQVMAPTMNLSLTKLGYFPHPRVVFLGCDHTPDPLTVLISELNTQLSQVGYQPEERPYHPHVTLRRNTPDLGVQGAVNEVLWSVQDFVLVQSTSRDDGARYSVLERFPLHPAS